MEHTGTSLESAEESAATAERAARTFAIRTVIIQKCGPKQARTGQRPYLCTYKESRMVWVSGYDSASVNSHDMSAPPGLEVHIRTLLWIIIIFYD